MGLVIPTVLDDNCFPQNIVYKSCVNDVIFKGGTGQANISVISSVFNGGPCDFVFDIQGISDPGYTDSIYVTLSSSNHNYSIVLPAGTYDVTILNNCNDCEVTIQYEIDEPTDDTITTEDTTDAICGLSGSFTGSICKGGFGVASYLIEKYNPLTFSYSQITNGIVIECVSYVVNNLTSGTYRVTYSRTLGCTTGGTEDFFSYIATISKPFVINSTNNSIPSLISGTSYICEQTSGVVTVTPTGGTAPYTYQWYLDGNPPGPIITDNFFPVSSPLGINVIITDSNGCTGQNSISIPCQPEDPPVTCWKLTNCKSVYNGDYFFVVQTDLSNLIDYVLRGIEIPGEVINPDDCWTVSVYTSTDVDYADLTLIPNTGITDITIMADSKEVFSNTTSMYPTLQDLIEAIIAGADLPFSVVQIDATTIRVFDPAYGSVTATFTYSASDPKDNTGSGSFQSGNTCGLSKVLSSYETYFSSCNECSDIVVCPVDSPPLRVIPDPVKPFFKIKESICDINVIQRFAKGFYDNVKQLRYGVSSKPENLEQLWLNKQISDLESILVPGYDCRSVPFPGCNWMPLKACNLLPDTTGGTSIIGTAGEDILAAKVVIIGTDGKFYLNNPTDLNTYQRVVGFSTADVLKGQPLRVLITGSLTSTWSLSIGAIYYATTLGGITTSVPSSGISQIVGRAQSAHTLLISIEQPVIL